ncbi:MAG TPA: hypothetical protein VGP43_06070 [Chitinophagaceae bacterium]|nr:hypothetical protein [Chitinophagaceae bacterium]
MNFFKNIWVNIKNEWPIIITLVFFLGFGLFCWLFWKPAEEFGLNFFTEISGAAITVVIIDRLIKNREYRKTIPQKLASYEDVRLFVTRYISFWTETYSLSVPEAEPENFMVFFSEEGMSKILSYLYLDSEPNITPPRTWWDWIPNQAKEFKNMGDKILDRHSSLLDPEAYGYIHQLTESSFNNLLIMLPSLRQTDILYKFPRVKVLGSYSINPQKEDFEAILGIIKWCEIAHEKLKKYNPDLKKITQYSMSKNRKLPLKCMIPPEIAESQIKEVLDFREKSI